MATYSKQFLSGSTNGKAILIAGTTSGSATPIHTAVAGTTDMDEVYIYASNQATSSVTCSILLGGTTEPTDVSRAVINPNAGWTLLIDGAILNNALTISAYANIASQVSIRGFNNRITNE